MASASAPPCTLPSERDASRALLGLGPSGVAGVLRKVLQRKSLQSLRYSASQHLQHLQHPFASRAHTRGRAEARASAYARGFGGVASVASVADDYSIYISMVYLQRSPQRLARGATQGVAARPCPDLAAAAQAIKYPRIFKGLGSGEPDRAGSAGNGVLGVRASARLAARARLGPGARLGLDQGETGPLRPRSPVERSPVASRYERYQGLGAADRLTVLAKAGVASAPEGTPPSLADPHPQSAPTPSSASPFGADAGAAPASSGRSGENADRREAGLRGSGWQGSRPAKTGVLRSKGSGEVADG